MKSYKSIETDTKVLSEDAKSVRNEYMREYRKRPGNKERQAEYQMAYWERQAEELRINK